MLRIITRFNALKITVRNSSTYDPSLLPVKRSHRKPRWVPIAKSKRFRVPERTKIPEDEEKEILRLHNNYRNNIKSIRKYLMQKHSVLNQASLDTEEILKHFKEDLAQCVENNDKWNEEVKVHREKRLAEALENDIARAHKRIEEEWIKEEQMHQFTEDLVRKEKEASVSFITPENIDAAIEKALAEPVDFNFAIDPNGEKISGRETRPSREKQTISLKQ